MFLKEFSFELTDGEMREYAAQMANGVQDLEAMKEERKIEVKRRNVEIIALQKQVDELAGKVVSGTELREVDCEWQKNFKDAMVDLVRLDTMEVVDSRPMNDEEKQMGLDDVVPA